MAKFISCKKNIEIAEGGERFAIPAGFIGEVPDWVEKHWYFGALCKDGTITAIVSTKDSDAEKAAQEAAAKVAAAEKDAERKRAIDEAKATAKAVAEAKATEEGLDVAATKKLVSEMTRTAVEEVMKRYAAQ